MTVYPIVTVFTLFQVANLDIAIQDRQLFKKHEDAILLQAHIDTGHGGLAKTHDWLSKNFYWEHMGLLIPDVLSSFHTCQLQRLQLSQHEFKLIPLKHAFHTISIDAVGPLPCSCSGC
ncbi:hypothetical protein DSO57_1036897 [Entomophthora muscae]|uniref:Uncharacterized protein n=1 Tax=Entomophthora muscae TaxID=34485 RepID=A0ACC2UJ05_9FUNG|nr:hypothetical protein DSO57_1036897 [Entomophthora muscae]